MKYYKLILIIILISCSKEQTFELPYFITSDFTPHWINSKTLKKSTHKISDFKLVNQNNEEITRKKLEGNIYVSNFFFTSCPSICPKMTNNIKIIEEEFKYQDGIKILSHSVTPWIDTPKILKKYEKNYNIDGSIWNLVTGEKKIIYDLARFSYFAEENFGIVNNENDFIHTELVFLIDKKSHIRGVYNGTLKIEMKRLIEDITILLKI
jgi:protein SCO1/2|tara:strand:+ start:41 stop:667 length:627 start_codon:yes stop_codon:yes gene_type:complete